MTAQLKPSEPKSKVAEKAMKNIRGILKGETPPEGVIPLHQTQPAQGVPAPWAKVSDFVPKGYLITPPGVFTNKDDPELVSGPCWVEALTRSDKGMEWGLVIGWLDQDGDVQSKAFPAHKLTDRGSLLASELASMGLKVVPGKQQKLMTYLGSFSLPSDYRLQSVSKLGWLDSDQKNLVYVLPDKTLSLGQHEKVIFQPEGHCATVHTMRSRGSPEKWKTFVAKPCEDSPLLIFVLATAFTPPLLKFAELDSGGFHLFGTSNKGKTTALQVASSVWGNGADPAAADDAFTGRWNTTGNALEATASAHNDGLLVLDEIGTCDARNFEKVIYDLFGGRGKARLRKNSMLQEIRSWRIMGLSTGELSVRQKIQEEGKSAKAGILNRMIDIPIHSGVFPENSGTPPAELAINLKKTCSRFYGTAGPQFIERLLTLEPDVLSLRQRIQADLDAWQKDLAEGLNLESFQHRALRRLACVLLAGLLAIEFDLLPFQKIDLIKAIFHIRDSWLDCKDNSPEPVQGLRAIKAFILKHQHARFGTSSENFRSYSGIRDLAGYFDQTRGLFLFTEDGLKEACATHNVRAVLHEARQRGFLFSNDPKKLKSKHTIADAGRISLYAIRVDLIESDL